VGKRSRACPASARRTAPNAARPGRSGGRGVRSSSVSRRSRAGGRA